MAQNIALESLLKEWNRLNDEKKLMLNQYNECLSELETAMEQLSGKKVWEIQNETVYDDQHPDYIKGSIEN
jgi:hypothetical protein